MNKISITNYTNRLGQDALSNRYDPIGSIKNNKEDNTATALCEAEKKREKVTKTKHSIGKRAEKRHALTHTHTHTEQWFAAEAEDFWKKVEVVVIGLPVSSCFVTGEMMSF